MPGNFSSSLAGAVLRLIGEDVERFSAFEREVRSVATERERLAHAKAEKKRDPEITNVRIRRR